MKKSLNLGNSIYQQKVNGSYSGLTVKDGMLINNRPDGKMGITQAVELKKAVTRAEKISTISDGFMLGELRSEMNGDSCS
jgi:ABC-type uncharacterized transport system ATPase component